MHRWRSSPATGMSSPFKPSCRGALVAGHQRSRLVDDVVPQRPAALRRRRPYGLASTVFAPTRWTGRRTGGSSRRRAPWRSWIPTELPARWAGIIVESHGHAHLNYADADDAAVEGNAFLGPGAGRDFGRLAPTLPRIPLRAGNAGSSGHRTAWRLRRSVHPRATSSRALPVGTSVDATGSWAADLRFEDLWLLVSLVAMVTSGALRRGCVETTRPTTSLTYGSRAMTLFRSLACMSRPVRKAKRTPGRGLSFRHSVRRRRGRSASSPPHP